MVSRINRTIVLAVSVVLSGLSGYGQSPVAINSNNPFAPSPKQRQRSVTEPSDAPSIRIEPAAIGQVYASAEVVESAATGIIVAKDTSAPKSNIDPTRTYSIGSGDMLNIAIIQNGQNGQKGSYFVSDDGTIDFPLAGGKVFVAGRTTDSIAELLKENTKLFSRPEIVVTVSQHLSHRVMVTGLVKFPGEQLIVRDAVPMFVIRASAVSDARAVEAIVRRNTDEGSESIRVALEKTPDFHVLPGDQSEFVGSSNALSVGYYYLSGEVQFAGKIELVDGLTLSKAIANADGSRVKARRARLGTRDVNGNTIFADFDLKTLRSGKSRDPLIEQGNIIEIID